MMFERFGHNVDWLLAMGAKIPDADRYRVAAAKLQRYRMLIFARYCQVMVRFERELYRNPDQDLNRLWWDLAEKYQEVKRPEGRNEPDYAAKIHIVTSPVYYHNYMLGELFASQVHHALIRAVCRNGSRFRRPRGGDDLRRQQEGRRVYARAGVLARPESALERIDPSRHRRGAEREGVRRGHQDRKLKSAKCELRS